jgi:uncharacterized protein YndB with AHSA1/START domain
LKYSEVGIVFTEPDLVSRWWSGEQGQVTSIEADLRVGDRTTVAILVEHTSREHRDIHLNSGMETGLQASLAKLEQVAISLAGG